MAMAYRSRQSVAIKTCNGFRFQAMTSLIHPSKLGSKFRSFVSDPTEMKRHEITNNQLNLGFLLKDAGFFGYDLDVLCSGQTFTGLSPRGHGLCKRLLSEQTEAFIIGRNIREVGRSLIGLAHRHMRRNKRPLDRRLLSSSMYGSLLYSVRIGSLYIGPVSFEK